MTLFKRTILLFGILLAVAASGCTQAKTVTTDPVKTTETAKEATKIEVGEAAAEVIDVAEADVAESGIAEADIAQENISSASNRVANNSAQPFIQITDSGIGEITAAVPFSVELVQAAFPTMDVMTETQMAEGVEYSIITVLDGGEKVMEIEPTVDESGIYRLSAMGSQVRSASGHAVGDSFSRVYGDSIPEGCFPGVDAIADAVSCPAPSAQNVRYVFEGRWEPLFGQLPSAAELSNSTLQTMFWIPDSY